MTRWIVRMIGVLMLLIFMMMFLQMFKQLSAMQGNRKRVTPATTRT